jgi:hypothetical protein
MSKYYILEYASGTKETGPQYPQVQKMGKDYDYKASNSIYELSVYRKELPNFIPNLDHFVLHTKAKPTDLISNALTRNTGFLVSGRLQHLLKSFQLPLHKFYQARVLHGKSFLNDYYWLQIVTDLSDNVDYELSEFYVYNMADVISKDLGSMELKSRADYEEKGKELKAQNTNLVIGAKRLVMSEAFNKDLDLFKVSPISGNTFIRERLCQALQEGKFTGVTIKPTNLINLHHSFKLYQ